MRSWWWLYYRDANKLPHCYLHLISSSSQSRYHCLPITVKARNTGAGLHYPHILLILLPKMVFYSNHFLYLPLTVSARAFIYDRVVAKKWFKCFVWGYWERVTWSLAMSAMGIQKRNGKCVCHIPGLEGIKLEMAGSDTLRVQFPRLEIESIMS